MEGISFTSKICKFVKFVPISYSFTCIIILIYHETLFDSRNFLNVDQSPSLSIGTENDFDMYRKLFFLGFFVNFLRSITFSII